MRYFAPAKINLSLDLGPVRADGYHEIRTIMQAVSLGDRLLVTPSTHLEICNPAVPQGDLIARAAALFGQAVGAEPRVRIDVRKRIPIGAGLGGGSSDAACALRALRELLRPDLPDGDLWALARALGSDVPFFLGPTPRALGTGRGEEITPLGPAPARFVVIAWPGEGLSTAEVYRRSAPGPGGASARVLAGAETGGNDLAAAAVTLSPALHRMLMNAKEAGVPLEVTGSGSAAFALFADADAAAAAKAALRPLSPHVALCQTLRRWHWQGNGEEGNE